MKEVRCIITLLALVIMGAHPGICDAERSGHEYPSTMSIYFAFDSMKLDAAAKSVLNQVAAYYLYEKSRNLLSGIILEGNTSSKGSREYNLANGSRMADAASSYLVEMGVPLSQIHTDSFGEARAVCVESITEACESQNRRVDIIFQQAKRYGQ